MLYIEQQHTEFVKKVSMGPRSGAVTVESVVGTAPLPVVVCNTVVVGGTVVEITAVVEEAVVEAVDVQSLAFVEPAREVVPVGQETGGHDAAKPGSLPQIPRTEFGSDCVEDDMMLGQ